MSYRIRHDYRACHTSGTRTRSAIRYIVIHDGEVADPKGAAESMGAWFTNPESGGSAHFGVDCDSIQQYLDLRVIAWGAPPLNEAGVHIEQAGLASLSRSAWLSRYHEQLKRVAWLLYHIHQQTGVPLRHLSTAEVKRLGPNPAKPTGIVTHAQVTAAFGQTDHTDPGPNYPLSTVILWAKDYTRRPLTAAEKRRLRKKLPRITSGSLRWLRALLRRILRSR